MKFNKVQRQKINFIYQWMRVAKTDDHEALDCYLEEHADCDVILKWHNICQLKLFSKYFAEAAKRYSE